MNVFDIINNISSNNDVVFSRDEIEQHYNPYLVVDFFSKFEDTVFIANESNTFVTPMGKWEHYLFLHSLVRKRFRRFRKTKKTKGLEDDLQAIMTYYDVSKEKAIDMLPLLSNINIEEIKTSLAEQRGGIIK